MHYVYIYYNEQDEPLYVGYTCDPDKREYHHKQKQWFSEVSRRELRNFGDKATALAAERDLIGELKPKNNNQYLTNEGWLTSGELAEQTGVAPRTIRGWISEGRGPTLRWQRAGRSYTFHPGSVQAIKEYLAIQSKPEDPAAAMEDLAYKILNRANWTIAAIGALALLILLK